MTPHRRAWSCLAVLGFAASGCVSTTLDRMFAADQYAEVVRTFEADSTLHTQERALYLAGVAYALPESPAYEPERALQIFDRLVTLYPNSSHAEHAMHLQQLLGELRQIEDSRALHERELAERERALATARAEMATLQDQLSTETTRADGLQVIIDRLNVQIQQGNAQIEALEAELEALKGIDLNRPPT